MKKTVSTLLETALKKQGYIQLEPGETLLGEKGILTPLIKKHLKEVLAQLCDRNGNFDPKIFAKRSKKSLD